MSAVLPIIYTDYSSHAEYIAKAKAGQLVSGVPQPECRTGFWRMVPDPPAAIEAVRKIYADRSLGVTLGANGRAFTQRYRVEVQLEKWHRIFQTLRSRKNGTEVSARFKAETLTRR